jgi:hypothetical protein
MVISGDVLCIESTGIFLVLGILKKGSSKMNYYVKKDSAINWL